MTPAVGPLLAQWGMIYRNMIRVPLGDAIPNIKALGIVVSDKKIFSCFPYGGLCKTCDPWGRAILPNGHNLNKLGYGPLDGATNQISRF